MGKIRLIIQREYLTRVRKPSFLVLTVLGPILMAALFITPVYFSMKEQKQYNVAVVDSSGRTQQHKLHGARFLKYRYFTENAEAIEELMKGSSDLVLYIPADTNLLSRTPFVKLYFRNQPGFIAVEKIKSDVSAMRDQVLYSSYNINVKLLDSLRVNGAVSVEDIKVGDDGKIQKTNSDVSAGIGFAGAFIMYIFIFLYGVQVMRGVMEEKTSRIVEVIVSSVKPFQLMMGKIIGVALVGLTQFCLWVLLTFMLISFGSAALLKNMNVQDATDLTQDAMKNLKQGSNVTDFIAKNKNGGQDEFNAGKIFKDLLGRNIYFLLAVFLFYFLGGYLLYSSLFAAVGAAVDSETDAQQFMLPVTIPIIFSIAMSGAIMANPSGPLAVWLSIIPFTSPVVMMIRLPFLEFGWELITSMLLLVLGFIFTTWLAGRIYRTGILMYGKKVTWKELWKWLFY